ncbi:restriction endonuclease subunit S [Streptomyces sp. NPDC014344]|uniref:restriction endonuclease subunit S n=1 Tax=Streptomyces sp. NPDC014344 TaxID=3364871 RepID=UPI0036FEA5B7
MAIVAEAQLPIVSSTEFVGLTPGPELETRFLAYFLQSETTRQILDSQVQSVTRSHQRVAPEDITHLTATTPTLTEQRRISDFLDAETTRITRLKQLREQQLRLWAERARAFASHLVTVGDAAETRTVDWLGPVPEEWSTPSIGRISRFIMGTTFPHEYQGEKSGDFPFVKVGDFQNADIVGRMQGAENWISSATARELGARIVPPGSILYARVGAALLLNRRRITTQPSVIDDNVRAICFDHGDPRFWAGLLSLLDMGQLVNPGPVPSISESQVSPIRVPDPDTPTQRKIADQLETSLKQWQKARILVERQLELIEERRQALITAAVTGQFDVSTASGRNVTEGVTA